MRDRAAALIRPLTPDDMPATLDLWIAAWQAAYPAIDFAARRGWTEERIAELQRTGSLAFVALVDGRLAGALVVNPQTGYIDQLVVALDHQGRGVADDLLDEARRLSPSVLDLHVNQDNARAIAFYRRQGFVVIGEGVNPRSGAPIFLMQWRPRS